MSEAHLDLVKAVHREAMEQIARESAKSVDESTIPFMDLPSLPADCEFFHEWNTYRGQVGKLIAQGVEDTWVLVKGDKIITGFLAWKLAYLTGMAMIAAKEIHPPYLIHQIRINELASLLEEYRLRCKNSLSRLAKTA